MAKATPELEEMSNLDSAMERSSQEFKESETDSSASTKSSCSNVPDSIVRSSRAKAEWEKQLDRDFLEIEDSILRSTVELEEAYNSLKLKKRKPLENDKIRARNSVSNENIDDDLQLGESILRSKTEQGGTLEGIKLNELKPLENYNLRDEASVSNRTEDKIANKQIAAVEESYNKLSTKTLEEEHKNEPGATKTDEKYADFMQNENSVLKLAKENYFYASQERILRKIEKLEKQRKSSGSLNSDQTNAAAIPNDEAVTNKQVREREFSGSKHKISRNSSEFEDDLDRGKKSVLQTMKAEEVSVLNEEKIINKHEDEREVIEKQDRTLRPLDLKLDLNAAQKSNIAELEKLTPVPKSQIDAVDNRQEDKIINKDENESNSLERQDTILRKALLLEDELEKKQKSEFSKLIDLEPISSCRIDTVDDRQAETCIPLMDEETVSIDLNDEDERSEAEESQTNTNSKTNWKYFRSLSSAKKSSVDIYLSDIRKRIHDTRKAASKASNCCKSTGVFTSSLFLCSLYVAVLSIVPIAMVVIGSLYLKQCPVQPYIPIYLVVSGAVGILYNCISVFRQSGESVSYSCFDGILNLFLLIWFILGCVWVYDAKHVEFYVTTDPDYCHETCYNFAYWLFNVIFILIGIAVGLVCCACCCSACYRGIIST